MRQALIVGARPITTRNKPFPRVPLEKGDWEIRGEGIIGSKVRLTIFTPTSANGGTAWFPSIVELPAQGQACHKVTGPCEISTEIIEAGRELHISLFAYPVGSNNAH